MQKRSARFFSLDCGWKLRATWFLMGWLICKSSTNSPVAPFLGFGPARKTGRRKDGRAQARPNFWNGANGSWRRLYRLGLRGPTFRRMRDQERRVTSDESTDCEYTGEHAMAA